MSGMMELARRIISRNVRLGRPIGVDGLPEGPAPALPSRGRHRTFDLSAVRAHRAARNVCQPRLSGPPDGDRRLFRKGTSMADEQSLVWRAHGAQMARSLRSCGTTAHSRARRTLGASTRLCRRHRAAGSGTTRFSPRFPTTTTMPVSLPVEHSVPSAQPLFSQSLTPTAQPNQCCLHNPSQCAARSRKNERGSYAYPVGSSRYPRELKPKNRRLWLRRCRRQCRQQHDRFRP